MSIFKDKIHSTNYPVQVSKEVLFYQVPQTQKARGIAFLMQNKHKIEAFNWTVPKHYVFNSHKRFSDHSFNFPVFARPCPVKPRHGFVDSILCTNAAQLNELIARTEQEEDQSEILITKPIPSAFNLIFNGNIVTFGCGNDGATSGKDCLYFYLNENPLSDLLGLKGTDLVAEGEMPFFEMVIDKETHQPYLVQVRSAPQVPMAKDYVPNKTEIKTILKAEGDLLAWEKKLHEVGTNKDGVVVDHFGGTLSSHYAIHAIVNKIPILTTRQPVLGEIIEQTVVDGPITDEEKEVFFSGFVTGFSSSNFFANKLFNKVLKNQSHIHELMRGIIQLALATLHNFSGIAIARDYGLIGTVLGIFLRVTFAISYGEFRYSKTATDKDEVLEGAGSRIACYIKSFYEKKSIETLLSDVVKIHHNFSAKGWSSSYGGKKWAKCTKRSVDLFNACLDRDIGSVVSLFNLLINEEHNGGKYLNKVIDVEQFNDAAYNPSKYFLTNMSTMIDILYAIHSVDKINKFNEHNRSLFHKIELEKAAPKVPKATTSAGAAALTPWPTQLFIGQPNKVTFSLNETTSKTVSTQEPITTGVYSTEIIPHWICAKLPDGTKVKIISKTKYKTLMKTMTSVVEEAPVPTDLFVNEAPAPADFTTLNWNGTIKNPTMGNYHFVPYTPVTPVTTANITATTDISNAPIDILFLDNIEETKTTAIEDDGKLYKQNGFFKPTSHDDLIKQIQEVLAKTNLNSYGSDHE